MTKSHVLIGFEIYDKHNGKEVDGNHGLSVIVEKRAPGLGRRIATPREVLADAGLADINAELKQFAVNTRRSPERILATEATDQFTNMNRNVGPP